ncbi:hypothetical protein MY8738_004366 [Beauveria namnaoensis]
MAESISPYVLGQACFRQAHKDDEFTIDSRKSLDPQYLDHGSLHTW